MNFKDKLHQWIEEVLIEDSDYYRDWASECGIYAYNGYGGNELVNGHDFIGYLHDAYQHEEKDKLYELINELYEYIKFSKQECLLFAEIFKIELNECEEDHPILICENEKFQDWVFENIINYLNQ